MMSLVALALVGLLVVVTSEEPLHSSSSSYEGPLLHSAQQAAKHAAQNIICDQPPCPPTALDTLSQSLHHGYQKTAKTLEGAKEFVSDRIEAAKESVEDAYQHIKVSTHETAEKAKHGMHETVEKAAHGMHDMASSYIPKKETKERPSSHAEETDPASYIMPGISQTMESLKRKFDDGGQEASTFLEDSPALDSLKTKVEQASSYIPSKEKVALHIQDKVHDMQRSTGDVANNVKKSVGDTIGDRKGECKDKLGGFLHGLKEKLTRSAGKDSDTDGLDMKVQELCSMLEDGESAQMGVKSDGSALHESYAYLMESALKAIDEAKEVFEKAIEGEGAEWKQKYTHLAETAKRAVVGAKEVFDRTAITTADDVKHCQEELKSPLIVTGQLLKTRLKEAAIHTKHRVSATFRSLVRMLYLTSFAAAFGVTLWITFFSGHLLSRALPRQQLAVVQSKIFPTYLRAVTGCMAICAIGHMVLHPWTSANWWEHLQNLNFSFSLVLSLCTTLLVEPKVTKIIFEKLKIEKEEGRGQSGDAMDDETKARLAFIDAKFKVLHEVYSFANLAILGGLLWHFWYLANRLVV